MSADLLRAQTLIDEGHRLRDSGRLDDAEGAYLAAAKLAPAAANPIHNWAVIRHLRADLAAAEAGLRRALELEPGRAVTEAALGAALLAQGRFGVGFPLYDAWRRTAARQGKAAPALPIPAWRGEPLSGRRFLIVSEEGYGDQIMFARYAALLRDRGASVTWVCPPPLARLFAEGLNIEAIPATGEVQLAGFDFYSPSSALPVLFGEYGDEPPAQPYLDPPKPVVSPGLSVGVVTNGNPNHRQDRFRSLPPELAAQFLALPGAMSLQPEETGARDFHDTAAIIAGLDLVISVDTAVAHLAGALGKPVWVLVYEPQPDWRWMQGRTDSPWYPSARLFRQPQAGDWAGVLAQVRAALAARR
jgi:hypothetical protein